MTCTGSAMCKGIDTHASHCNGVTSFQQMNI